MKMAGIRTTSQISESFTHVNYDSWSCMLSKFFVFYTLKTTYVDLVQSVFDIQKPANKRKVSSETAIAQFEPAPIRGKKIGGVCYYIALMNTVMLVK